MTTEVVLNVLNCDITVSEFKLWSHLNFTKGTKILGKCMKSLMPTTRGYRVSLLFFYMDGMDIK